MTDKQKEIEKLGKKYTEAHRYGLDVQKEGIKIVRESEKGQDIINIMKSHSDILNDARTQAWIAGANATLPSHPPENLGEIQRYASAIGTTTSASCVYFTGYSSGIFNAAEKPKLFTVENYEKDMQELDEHLNDFMKKCEGIGDLVAMRHGAWDIYSSAAEANLVSASHHIREILSKIISQWATNERVKQAKWWKKPKGTEKEASPKQRLRYLIFGPDSANEKSLDLVEGAIKQCYDDHKKLKKVAHGSKELKEVVKKAIRNTEYAMLTIFRARKASGL